MDRTLRSGTKQHEFTKYVSQGQDASNPFWGPNKDKGAGLFGAVNYLASLGTNSMYMLTTNLGGDGDDVFVYSSPENSGSRDSSTNPQAAISYENRKWFDVSKLDQWTNAFEHMQTQGQVLHLLFQETETDQILDGGELGPERKLYLRELVSRLAHFIAVIWNHGEENRNSPSQRREFIDYVSSLDAYGHPNVIHHWPGEIDSVLQPLLGFYKMAGPSMQIYWNQVYGKVVKYFFESESVGVPWVLAVTKLEHQELACPMMHTAAHRAPLTSFVKFCGELCLVAAMACQLISGIKSPTMTWMRKTSTQERTFSNPSQPPWRYTRASTL